MFKSRPFSSFANILTYHHTTIHSQRGAMFGLDARLALGIFALLAMVAGSVAYWRIGAAQQARLFAELETIHQALQGYQADMGTFFVFTLNKDEADADNTDDITALWDITKVKSGFQNNWRGPYVQRHSRTIPGYGPVTVLYATEDRKGFCETDTTCYVWLVVPNVKAEEWQQLNKIVDEGGGTAPEPRGQDVSMGRLQADAPNAIRQLYFRTISRN